MVKQYLYLDTETYSEEPIANGTYKYAENAAVMICTYALGDGEVKVWDASPCGQDKRAQMLEQIWREHETIEQFDPKNGDVQWLSANISNACSEWLHSPTVVCQPDMPEDLRRMLNDEDITQVWHNSMFDRNILKYAENIHVPPERIFDTAVTAAMHGLPMGLDKLCKIFGIAEDKAKSKDGRRLIMLFCKPRPKSFKLARATAGTHPEEWAAFIDYAKKDVVAMREIHRKIPKWNCTEGEMGLWCLDQRINDRGYRIDTELTDGALDAVTLVQKKLAAKTKRMTEGYVQSATQRDELLLHLLAEHGVSLPDMTKSTLQRRMDDESLPKYARDLIATRLETATTSTSKYKKLRNGVNVDGRLRGTLQFCGASRTGRWSGRTFQPQNLPRPTHKQAVIEAAIPYFKLGCIDLVSDDVMKLASSSIRSCIVAEEHHQLVVSDLSNIEGRVAAWLAGEQWKVDAFSAYDNILGWGVDKEGNPQAVREGHDLYALAYARSFNTTPEAVVDNKNNGDGSMRQLGKVQELALGYGGGVGAFVSMVANYRIDLTDMATKVLPNVPADVLSDATRFYNSRTDAQRFGLTKDVFVACDSVKRLWRASQPEISSYWYALEDAMRRCIETGSPQKTRRIIFDMKKAWLRVLLPSGRVLCYPSPKISEEGTITYSGINQYTRQWGRIKTYGGKIFENICQAVARDVMTANMPRIEQRGFDILLTVHDELITEVPTSLGLNDRVLSALMAEVPPWAEGLPLAAAGFTADRYRKD